MTNLRNCYALSLDIDFSLLNIYLIQYKYQAQVFIFLKKNNSWENMGRSYSRGGAHVGFCIINVQINIVTFHS